MGAALYKKLFPVLLADNGSEFSDPVSLEFTPDRERHSHLFYRNPSAPHQKGSCEVNHVRRANLPVEISGRIPAGNTTASTLWNLLLQDGIYFYKWPKTLCCKAKRLIIALQYGVINITRIERK